MKPIDKDELYELLTDSPDKQKFAELMKDTEYETDSIDFKETWIEKGKLAKIILAMANYGGGCIIFGIKENENHIGEPVGLKKGNIKDQAKVNDNVKKYLPENINWDLQTFSYEKSEYEKMENKTFQILIVHDTPEYLPFISVSEGEELKNATIYTRRQTQCVIANNSELQSMIDRRIKTQHISKISFSEHLKQLQELYKYHSDTKNNPLHKIDSFLQFGSSDFTDNIDQLIDFKLEQIKQLMGLK